MSARLLNGRDIAEKIKLRLKKEVRRVKDRCGRAPTLCVIRIGEDKAAGIYVKSQEATAREVGINYRLVRLGASVSQDELIEEIKRLNEDRGVDAVMLSLPLPKGISLKEALSHIEPCKNAETPNPTAQAVMELVRSTGVSLYGKEAVVVGHGELVGRPIAMSLLDKFATVTVCHIGTASRGNLKGHVSRAEVLVCAVGKPNVIKAEWVRRGSIVIDVGISKRAKRILGDVEFEGASKRARFITPVPGGVGPLTVAMLMRNCVELLKRRAGAKR